MSETAQLPADFEAAVERMIDAFVDGSDEEADTANEALTARMLGLPPYLWPVAEQRLEEAISVASARRNHRYLLEQLPHATQVGSRAIVGRKEAVDLQLPDGHRVAVIVPTGGSVAARTYREALLRGTCETCGAQLAEDLTLVHKRTCPAHRR